MQEHVYYKSHSNLRPLYMVLNISTDHFLTEVLPYFPISSFKSIQISKYWTQVIPCLFKMKAFKYYHKKPPYYILYHTFRIKIIISELCC